MPWKIRTMKRRRMKMSESIEKKVMRYQFNGSGVRVVMDGEDPWFVAKDVCNVLGIGNSRQALSYLDDDEKGVITNDTLGGNQQMATVNESGLYNLIMRSRKPEASEFRRWVTHDVLPSIRKHGVYMTDNVLDQVKADPAMMDRMIDQLVEDRMRIRKLELERDMAEDERDVAIKQRAWISHRREAQAMQNNSVLARRINALNRAKQDIEDEIEALKPYADRYHQWCDNISKGHRKKYIEDSDEDYLF